MNIRSLISLLSQLAGALLLTLWVLSTICIILFIPPVFIGIYNTLNLPEAYSESAQQIVKTMWSTTSFSDLNITPHPLLEKEVHHFSDVRKTLNTLLIYSPTQAALMLIFFKHLPWRKLSSTSLLIVCFIGGGLALWGGIHWRSMFRALHYCFFQDTSWILPWGCSTLKLFPYIVWQVLGAILLTSTFLILMSLSTISRLIKKDSLLTSSHKGLSYLSAYPHKK